MKRNIYFVQYVEEEPRAPCAPKEREITLQWTQTGTMHRMLVSSNSSVTVLTRVQGTSIYLLKPNTEPVNELQISSASIYIQQTLKVR